MPPQLKPSLSTKRARSAENSASATPVPEDLPSVIDEHRLPAFLRQTKADISLKFDDICWQQDTRIAANRQNKDPNSSWTFDNNREVKARNRYLDIKPYANSRIKLNVPEGGCDYINASPIRLVCSKSGTNRRYIATQGPKEAGVGHFWQMIWQETDQVAVIVMLTQLYEGARDKCFQYYPEDHGSEEVELQLHDQNGEVMVGTVKVEESVYDESCKATIRKIRFSCNGQTKTVYHLFFLAWPDFSVPELEEDRNALLKLIDLSREKNGGWDNPRIVHCSAGVGRSGTFIALEHLLAELEIGHLDNINDSEDCIYDTVSKLREQRMTMVQSEQQYHFLYTMLADAYRKRLSDGDQIDKKPVKGPATEMLPPGGGEPSPKAIRLSRSLTLKNVFSDIRERSRSQRSLSRRREAEKTEGKTP